MPSRKRISKIERGKKALGQLDSAGSCEAKKRFDMLREQGLSSKMNNKLKALQLWHLDMIEDRIMHDMTYPQLAKKYGCTKEWATVICTSDVGIVAAKKLVDKFDIKVVREKLKFLSAKCTPVVNSIITGQTDTTIGDDGQIEKEGDGIPLIERGRYCLEVMKLAGAGAPKQVNITLESKLKEIESQLSENEKRIQEAKRLALEGAVADEVSDAVLEEALDD